MTEKKVYAAISAVAGELAEKGISKEKNKAARSTTHSVESMTFTTPWLLLWLSTSCLSSRGALNGHPASEPAKVVVPCFT